ncbi:hypothetical protein TSUD_413870 [Trifolium subterraneum]|uniref:Glycoside hydrolase family 3 C-terminal domain-containing protein n=1 Tax=Trifolium subterraneum TaxID=3900 RepID=A0A2Z6P966_TRISU|nr:hypothetical protein TSUD_413870 [Trifolium subterraneum]
MYSQVDVLFKSQHYTKTPEEAAAKSILAGLDLNSGRFLGQYTEASKQPYGKIGPKDACTSANQKLAREAARQGIVLLKNSPGSLPLNARAIKSLAVIGPNANARTMIGNYEGEVQGMASRFVGIGLDIGLSNCIGSSTPVVLASFCVLTWIHTSPVIDLKWVHPSMDLAMEGDL